MITSTRTTGCARSISPRPVSMSGSTRSPHSIRVGGDVRLHAGWGLEPRWRQFQWLLHWRGRGTERQFALRDLRGRLCHVQFAGRQSKCRLRRLLAVLQFDVHREAVRHHAGVDGEEPGVERRFPAARCVLRDDATSHDGAGTDHRQSDGRRTLGAWRCRAPHTSRVAPPDASCGPDVRSPSHRKPGAWAIWRSRVLGVSPTIGAVSRSSVVRSSWATTEAVLYLLRPRFS